MLNDPPDDRIEVSHVEEVLPRPLNFTERYNLSPVTFAFISLVVVFILYQIVGGIITFLLFGGKFRSENLQWLRFATMAGQVLLILVPTIILTRMQTENLREGLRIRRVGTREIVYAVIGVLSLQQVLQVYMYAQEQIPIPSSLRPFVDSIRKLIEETYKNLVSAHSVPELLYVLLVVALVPAFCEELLFRGLVQKNFETGLKRWWGVILTGTIFGAYHFNPFSFIPLAALGVYFGFLVFRSKSILTSVVAHFVNNLFAVLAVFFNADENFLLSEPTSSVSVATLLFALVGFGLVFIVSTCALVRTTREMPEPIAL